MSEAREEVPDIDDDGFEDYAKELERRKWERDAELEGFDPGD